ncbi:MAG: tetratricopeptide repeat protein [Cyclobacteriaceae bacterium]|nr:tetratricopeptide repeat protein [Cyclobacteriaceae bacterium]UYN85442.1 MAG: tetratricopeptide repeat protein [Cyclobacteriaceae bacterium]
MPDSEKRVDLLNALAFELYDHSDSMAQAYAEQALSLSQRINYPKGLKDANTLVGLGWISKGNYKLAFRYLRLAERIEVKNAPELDAYNYTLMGNIYRDISQYDSAIFFYNKVLGFEQGKLSDNTLATVLKNLGYLYSILWRNDEALKVLHQAESLVAGTHDLYLLGEIYSTLGVVYENITEFEKADAYFKKFCSQLTPGTNYFHLIKCELRQAELLLRQALYSEALSHCFNAFTLLEHYEYPPQTAEVYTLTGEVYAELGQYDLASRYYFQALKITEQLGLKRTTARLYAELGWVYKEQFNFDLALNYLNRSLALREAIGDRYGVSNCYNIRGLVYYQQKKYAQAIQDLNTAISMRKAIGHVSGVAASIFNLSLVYEAQGRFQQALNLLYESKAVEENNPDLVNVGITYNQLAALLIKMKRLDEAEQYLNLAAVNAGKASSLLLKRNNFRYYSQLYEAKGDFKKAFEYLKLFQQYDDSVYTQASATKLAELEALYRVEQKEQQIKLLNQEKELQGNKMALQQSRIRAQNIIIGSALLGLVLVSVFAFNIFLLNKRLQKANFEILEQKEEIQTQTEELVDANGILVRLNREISEKNEEIQAQSEELMEANQTINEINVGLEEKINERTNKLKEAYKELDTFFYRSSHDFRRPLTTFMGLSEVAKITVKDQNALELFAKVNETAHTLDRMLVKLQSISDVGAQQLVYKEVFLTEMISEVLLGFKDDIQQKGIKTQINVRLSDVFCSYPAMVKIILENLIENAVQFSSPNEPYIQVSAFQEHGEVVLEIRDNGQGIDDELKDRIFDMYFRGTERSKGNGLGLYIVRKAVEKLNGTVTWSGKQYAGTTFIVRLPMSAPVHS